MKSKVFILVIVLVVLAAGGWYFISERGGEMGPKEEGMVEIEPAEVLVFEVKDEAVSDYQKDQAFSRFTNAKNTINENIANGLSKEDNANFFAWLEIASVQKLIGDYERAIEIWTWFTQAHQGNSVSPANLADMYKSFVVDRDKSEKYYLIALEREKHDFQIYYGLHELYRYVFEDADRAGQVLEEGRENNLENRNYVTELLSYLVELERLDEASELLDGWLVEHPEDYGLRAKVN